jgi:hypothetical protein
MKIFLNLLFIFSFVSFAQQAGHLSGKVLDAKTGEALPGVNIILKGTYYGAATDINGNFSIRNIEAGSYTVEISFIGYKTNQFTGTIIEPIQNQKS